jgi:hypothetical protein
VVLNKNEKTKKEEHVGQRRRSARRLLKNGKRCTNECPKQKKNKERIKQLVLGEGLS